MSRYPHGILLLSLLVATACAAPTVPIRRGVSTPQAMAVICTDVNGNPQPISNPTCTDDSVRVLVSGNGTLSLALPSVRTWVDTDVSTPGFTPLHMPGLPGAIAVDGVRGHAYVALPILGWILRVDLTQLADYKFSVLDWQDVGFSPQALLLVETPEPRLFLADPANGRVAWLPLSTFGKQVNGQSLPPHFVLTGGSPASLALSTLTQDIYVGHLAAGFISILSSGDSVSAPSLIRHISITAACNNGLDDDGDGLTDRDDSGCDGPSDRFEGNPELGSNCTNTVDDDGDGFTDALDPGCASTPTTDACRNGIDDDGDGLIDFAVFPGGGSDPGCSGWGDTSEWSDRPLCRDGELGCTTISHVPGLPGGITVTSGITFCSDGIDNDGDGLTDAADSDCHIPGNAFEGPLGCINGVDDDGDGQTDAADPDCYNRNSQAEVANATAIHSVVAATFGGEFVVIADRTRRALLAVDCASRTLLQPQPGQISPWARASRLDERDGIPGLSLADMPISLAPAIANDSVPWLQEPNHPLDPLPAPTDLTVVTEDIMAIGLAQVGVQFLRFHPFGDHFTVSLELWPLPTSSTPTTSAGRPLLLVPGATLDLPTTVPTRFSSFGPLTISTDPVTGQTIYYGLHPLTATTDHRSETWRFTAEGPLPGGVGKRARLLGGNVVHDPTADFCLVGALPGDRLQLDLPTTSACQGGGTYDFVLTNVNQDSLGFDPATGKQDVAVTYDNQLTFAATTQKAFTGDLSQCLAAGGVAYKLRAGGWLVKGSRSGILSSRLAVDGQCAPLDPLFLNATRVIEPTLQPTAKTTDLLACPNVNETLDPAVWKLSPLSHPVFTAQLRPGCDDSTFDENGNRIVHLVPTIREMEWVFGVSAAFVPRTSAVGANPLGMGSGPTLGVLYVIDEGAGLMQFVNISDGLPGTTPLD